MTAPELPPPCVDGAPERIIDIPELAGYVAAIQSALCSCGSKGHTEVKRHCGHPHCPMLVARCVLCGEVVPGGVFDAREHAA